MIIFDFATGETVDIFMLFNEKLNGYDRDINNIQIKYYRYVQKYEKIIFSIQFFYFSSL